jgi:hypothetical protein
MASAQTAPRAEETAEAPAEEETLPESEPATAQGPATETTAAFTDIQIPTWNLGERLPIAPQVWDADTPQVDAGTAEEDVNLINLDQLEDTPAVPEDVRNSPKKNGRENEDSRRNRKPMADWSYS